jgi:glutamate synthase domain-containing protein 3
MKMAKHKWIKISGTENKKRIPSRILEEMIHQKIKAGHRRIEIDAYGQHGIGGRLWDAGSDKTYIRITGQSGQRTGSLGHMNTEIEIMGPASDDVGWLNAGAQIVVHGSASNGILNGGAQGRVYIAGSIGARGMTMTKRNPRFDPPELWVLGSVGDYFGEFMAGGIAVICGYNASNPDLLLGYRPLVGMVGGKVFVRGTVDDYSKKDAKQIELSDQDWQWLTDNLKIYLKKIKQSDLYKMMAVRSTPSGSLLKPRPLRKR